MCIKANIIFLLSCSCVSNCVGVLAGLSDCVYSRSGSTFLVCAILQVENELQSTFLLSIAGVMYDIPAYVISLVISYSQPADACMVLLFSEESVWLLDDVLERMPYTDAVLKEVMRLQGIVDGVWRQALEDLEVQGRRVPKVPSNSDHCPCVQHHLSLTALCIVSAIFYFKAVKM